GLGLAIEEAGVGSGGHQFGGKAHEQFEPPISGVCWDREPGNVELRIANVEVAPIRHSKFDIVDVRNLDRFMGSLHRVGTMNQREDALDQFPPLTSALPPLRGEGVMRLASSNTRFMGRVWVQVQFAIAG